MKAEADRHGALAGAQRGLDRQRRRAERDALLHAVREREGGLAEVQLGDERRSVALGAGGDDPPPRRPDAMDRQTVLVDGQPRGEAHGESGGLVGRAVEPVGPRMQQRDPHHRAVRDIGGEPGLPAQELLAVVAQRHTRHPYVRDERRLERPGGEPDGIEAVDALVAYGRGSGDAQIGHDR